jgi:alpha-ketoglutarate-dependent taurine dioxygenase
MERVPKPPPAPRDRPGASAEDDEPSAGRPLDDLSHRRGFGIELTGIDLSRPLSTADLATVVAAFEEHSLVLFRNTNITMEQQVAFSHQFAAATGAVMEMGYGNEWEDGGIRHSAAAPATDPQLQGAQPHATDAQQRAWEEGVSNGPGVFVPERRNIADRYKSYETQRSKQNGTPAAAAPPPAPPSDSDSVRGWQEMAVSERNIGYGPGNGLWHTDSSFKLRGALASILTSVVVPESGGGQTDFASMRQAYSDLPAEQQSQLEGLVPTPRILIGTDSHTLPPVWF